MSETSQPGDRKAKEPKKFSHLKLVGTVGAGSFAAGTGAGIFAGGVMPLKTFDWILSNGDRGIMLVVIFVLLWLLIRQQAKTDSVQKEKDEEIRLAQGQKDEAIRVAQRHKDEIEARLFDRILTCEKERHTDHLEVERAASSKIEGMFKAQIRVNAKAGRALDRTANVLENFLTSGGHEQAEDESEEGEVEDEAEAG